MSPPADAALIQRCAREIRDAFRAYNDEFRAVTQRAKGRFERRDWLGGQQDAAERIELYDQHVNASTKRMHALLGDRAHDRGLWKRIKTAFSVLADDYPDLEFVKTYFSSVTRRVFGTVGVHPDIEFVGPETIPLRNIEGPLIGNNYVNRGSLAAMFREMLEDHAWSVPFADLDGCARRVADDVRAHYAAQQQADSVLCVDMIPSVFYRETRAYVIGRATGWTRSTPLCISFENGPDGIRVDAVLQTKEDVSVLFGFARSYFQADLHPVGSAIVFLRKVMPALSVNELFTVLGRAKQGKTERYRVLSRHLELSRDQFIVAPGKKGMVMAVFTQPSHDVVFKVIRDRFAAPKETTAEDVKRCYRLVVRNNWAGRLVDAQEFRSLRLAADRFDQTLLDELLSETGKTTRL
ncbi:MAG: bifunctional isocitrate dehydrogenase kinase/phosphatase, partial [Planctomycetes bacterium]|nr:bifunctional isocitrate dehydrogenase kinase/phosphatase [Planctomycetota bacterium]